MNGKFFKRWLSVCLLMALVQMTAVAQTNPQKGFVITNENDTLWGTIDFVSAKRCARECLFKKDGEADYRAYAPQDIRGYRLSDKNIFYVSRTLPVSGRDQTFFAEYLLQGGVSLYRYVGPTKDLYYLVNNRGEVAVVSEYAVDGLSDKDAYTVKKEALRPAMQMLAQSEKATRQLWSLPVTAERLVNIAREYNEEFCREDGDCIVFEYDSKMSADRVPHFRVELGMASYFEGSSDEAESENHRNGLRVGVGADFALPRVSRQLSLQTMVYADWYGKEDIALTIQAGCTYRFLPDSRLSPMVQGGLLTVNAEGIGAYAGVGCSLNVGCHRLDLSLRGSLGRSLSYGRSLSSISVQIGFAF